MLSADWFAIYTCDVLKPTEMFQVQNTCSYPPHMDATSPVYNGSTSHAVATETQLSPVAYQIGVTQGGIKTFCLIVYCLLPTNEPLDTVHPVANLLVCQRVQCGGLHSFINLLCNCHEWPHVTTVRTKHIRRRAAFHSFIWPTSHMNQPLTTMKCCSRCPVRIATTALRHCLAWRLLPHYVYWMIHTTLEITKCSSSWTTTFHINEPQSVSARPALLQ
jgi:hypothetical protein